MGTGETFQQEGVRKATLTWYLGYGWRLDYSDGNARRLKVPGRFMDDIAILGLEIQSVLEAAGSSQWTGEISVHRGERFIGHICINVTSVCVVPPT